MTKSANSIFTISQKTKAIIAKNSNYYRSIILEGKDIRHSIHTAEQILDNSCFIFGGTTLEDRRNAVKDVYNIHNKIPIPVIPQQGVYMIPTSSVKRKDCVWLSYYHIDYFKQRDNKTYIVFTDGTDLFVNASISTIDMQHKRASQIIARNHRFILFDARGKQSSHLLGGGYPFLNWL